MQFALELAREANQLIQGYFQSKDLQIDRKHDRTLVTKADREAEKLMRMRIEAKFPHDSILGEEWGETQKDPGRLWILDPIDGTQSFVCGVPLFGSLIGYVEDDQPTLGVCSFPALDEVLFAETSQGSWWMRSHASKPERCRVSEVSRVSEAMLCSTTLKTFEASGKLHRFLRLEGACAQSRGWSDCYGYALVATGRADLVLDPLMHIWDCAALEPIIREAGGFFGDWSGKATIASNEAIACNLRIKNEALLLLKAE